MPVALALFFAANLADGVLLPFFALWAVRDAGVPVAVVGLLLGCYAGGELLANPFVGGLSDRLGRRPVLLGSTLGVALGFLALFFVHGTVAAAMALTVIGVFESVLHPTAAAIVADVVPPSEFRRYYGLMRLVASIGGVAGPVLGALLVGWSLSGVFLAAAASLFAACLLVAIALPETRHGTGAEEEDGLGALGAVMRDRTLAGLLVPLAVIEIASSWIETVIPLQATSSGSLTAAGVGWLFAYANLLGVVGQMPVLRLCRAAPGSQVVLAGGGLLVLAFAALALLPGLAGAVIAVTGLALAGMLIEPLVQALVMELAPIHARATYTAALSTVHDLKDAAGPALGTALFAASAGLPWLLGIGLVIPASAALVLRLHGREPGHPASEPT
ncbi:MFS transporter [uncultured Methylobacterium sp.]|uniref:MFS transporter n=1 Tax=uncultured Methylobacterium sp. TaxID=157278 RepID=UPI002597DAF3|nr:MFS transporter [uncultured Methylobacterium sp.]